MGFTPGAPECRGVNPGSLRDMTSRKAGGSQTPVEGRMEIDEATVRRVARLARIKVTPEEAKGLEKELSGILEWVKQLDEVKTEGVEPMTRVVDMKLKMRHDEVTDGEIADAVTSNAPEKADSFFVVPKVVE
jgi:aspartyl-tRNA(Asn)/glutamyl-tRNA(Gln) amidotransferase subunit C